MITQVSLRERHYGIFQGLTYAEAKACHPHAYALLMMRDVDYDFEGGESLRTFAARVTNSLVAIANRHRGEHVLVVGLNEL